MRHFYLDTETRLFAPGYMAPKIVCLAAEDPDLLPLIFAAHEGKANGN